MKHLAAVVIIVTVSSSTFYAARIDPRLAAVRKAYVVAVDDLGDDRPVAACLADHLHDWTPIESVKTREEADVIFKVRAHLPSATSRVMLGIMGGSPSVHLSAERPTGEKLWDDGAKVRRGNTGGQVLLKGKGESGSIECSLAEEIANTLRDAMRKARDNAR